MSGRSILLLTSLVLTAATAAAADPVDDYVRSQLQQRRLPGVSLAVVKDGRIVKAAGYGLASLELDAPASEKTVYEIGSISKQIAACAVLLLVEDGKLRLDDPISKYVDGTPPTWAPITVRHILSHTAGLADFDTGDIGFSYRREYTTKQFVDLLASRPLEFQPGTQWKYTNAFPLIGAVVERTSGMSYMDFVRGRIFTPLKLQSARFKMASDVVPGRADGYLFANETYKHGETLRPSVIAPNGGVMMNVVDFAAWDVAMTAGRLLSAASLEEMATPTRLTSGTTVSHGLGWFMDTFNGHRFGAHWGTTVAGYSAVIRRYTDDHLTVIMLANLDDGGFGIDAMSKRIADMYVSGVDIHGLSPKPDPSTEETARLKKALVAVAEGREDDDAPGLGGRLPQPVRDRIARALKSATALDYLGGEAVGPLHSISTPTSCASRGTGPRLRTVHVISHFDFRAKGA